MTSITIYDGSNTIGGNKIYLEESGEGIFLDFGMNFKKYEHYFKDFLTWRTTRGIYDLISLNLIPKLNIYRPDIIPSDLNMASFPSLNVNAILLSHAHLDHFGNIGLLKKDFPIVASPTTIILLKGILDISKGKLGSDVAYFSPRFTKKDDRIVTADNNKLIGRNFISVKNFSESVSQFLSSSAKWNKKLEKGTIQNLDKLTSHFEINGYDVDHSIYGATGYVISSDTTIAYTGDFRLHGKKGEMSKTFINKAKEASILIIEGTRAAREDINESEETVYENCLEAAEESKGLMIADFTSRNLERLEIFQSVAKKTGRILIIPSKEAYLLNALKKVDGIDRTSDILVYNELKTTKPYWENRILSEEMDINYIDSLDISKTPDNYILCFSLFDLKNLLDVRPFGGTYLYSSSEAFEEESEFDFVRLNNWLSNFGFKILGFEVVEEDGKLKPKFTRGYHASGHASKSDLIKTIESIDPDIIIPVHTDTPSWFDQNFDNVVLLKDGETYPK